MTSSAGCGKAAWKTLAMLPFMERCAACIRPAPSSRMSFHQTRDRTASTTASMIAAAGHSTNCSTGGAPHMPDSNQSDDVARYAAAVRAALAPLPDAERENLLEDLESHLEEVASESALPLRERLGAPEAYAEDLKSAYGADGVQAKPKQSRLIRDRSMALIHGVLGTGAYREMRALLPELRPGWWVLRAYLAVLILAFIFRDGGNLRPIPNPFSSHGLLQIVATVIAIVISVRLGRRGMPAGRVWRGGAVAVNFAVAVLALPVLVSMGTGDSYTPSADQYLSSVSAGYYPM